MKTERRKYNNLTIGKRYFFDGVKDVSGILIMNTEKEIRFDRIGFAPSKSNVFYEIVEE